MKSHYKGIVFDLDGTLLDTSLDLTDTLNHVRRLAQLEDLRPEAVMKMMGDGLQNTLLRGLEGSQALAIEYAMHEFLHFYQNNYTQKTKAYPGVYEVLKQLQAQGITLGVLSNKREEFIDVLLKMHFQDIDFKVRLGDVPTRKRKPDPMGLLQACRAFQLKPNQVLMVGDSVVDMEAGLNAGTGVLPVAWGYQSIESLRQMAKIEPIETPQQLINWVV
jgi:phosphoglycolate phosphatase